MADTKRSKSQYGQKTKFMIIKSKFNTISNTNDNEILINGKG